MKKKQKKDYLLNIYKNINSIKDIIQLKNNKKKFDFAKDDKFNKLYNLIPCLEKLDKIIGMNDIKDSIFKSICYFIHGLNNNEELHHVIITGPPGVGKTTIAKIIGEIYLKLGFLENDTFITARRSDLIAKYLGQTAIKTQEVIDKALGGVLFIDEAYSLGNSEKRDSFSKECIDTINQNMTRLDHPWLLIIAGYKEEVTNSFLAYNPGLERRFTVKLDIKGYSANELLDILLKFIEDENWTVDKDAITLDIIKENLSNFKFFAGDMRKLFQISKQNYSVRLMNTSTELEEEEKVLIKEDFIKSIQYFNTKDINDNMKEYIRASMYL
jgi:SpoVK/Ycf46/Vps4 family AAA+-type ATPase